MATLEAMASGLPVCVSRAAGLSEHLTDGLDCLLLNDPEDVEAIAGHLERLADSGLRVSLGQEARKTAERFSWDSVVDQTLAVYNQAL
jgi:UDP-glucose:(heptosyl)LPS alpha-1,3-glucosyltransferase